MLMHSDCFFYKPYRSHSVMQRSGCYQHSRFLLLSLFAHVN